MLKYIIKRLLAGVLTMVVLITVAFFMMHAMPGGPFSPSEEKNVPIEILDRIAASYGLDQPVWKQYLDYWDKLLHGDLGISYKTIGTVNEKITGHVPASARIGALAVIFSMLIGIPLGLLAALYRGKAADFTTLALATIGISVPVFVLSLLLSYLFSVKLDWLPTYGLDSWASYVLPVLCLSFSPIAYIARQTRSSMLEALEQDYIRTARAKGVSELAVISKHALKNALTPIITYLGPLVAGLLTGSFIVESRFSIPGLGYYFVRSVSDRDYTMIMGIVIFFGLFVVICNLISDILLAIIDPRVRLAEH